MPVTVVPYDCVFSDIQECFNIHSMSCAYSFSYSNTCILLRKQEVLWDYIGFEKCYVCSNHTFIIKMRKIAGLYICPRR